MLELGKQSALTALKRFIARRGLPTTVHTDNGTNFVGGSNDLKEIYEWLANTAKRNSIRASAQSLEVQWVFNVPYAPHRGGIWEAAVRRMKFHFKRIVGNEQFTFEMLMTVLAEIEAILNSRPLTPLSPDPNDLVALTPGHFLIGQELLTLPEFDLSDHQTNRLSK